ncbi:MAG: D-glycero-alpha-D-manno-heptose-1,7-bisphosphate 7-phosphatase [Candidatus Zipacnadales bacterium]
MKRRQRAVFLDRDGVLNLPVYYPERDEHDSPLWAKQLVIYRQAAPHLERLRKAGFLLIIVTNQPAWAKGKTTHEDLEAVRDKLLEDFRALGVEFDGYYCCYHHPTESIIDPLRIVCECRKPSPGLLRQAADDWGIDLRASWMIGDRDTDIQAGQSVGCRTILVESTEQGYRGRSNPDFRCRDLVEACHIILKGTPHEDFLRHR